MNAHNLAMVALTARMQHERNYDDAAAGQEQAEAAGHRSDQRRDGLGHRLLRPGPAEHHHRHGRQDGRLHDAEQVRHRRLQRGDGHPGDLQRPGRPPPTASAGIVVAYDKKGNPVTTRRPRGGRGHDRLAPRGDQPEPAAVAGRPALLRARRPVRQHRGGPVVGRGRQDLPEAGRLPRHRVGLRRRHRLREVLERQVPLFAATCPTSR